jgi:hypothetical protein
MLFREIIAVYCENQTEHINTLCGQNAEFSSYLTGNTLRLHYKAQPVNAVKGKKRCLLLEPYGTHKYTLWAECRVQSVPHRKHITSPLQSPTTLLPPYTHPHIYTIK